MFKRTYRIRSGNFTATVIVAGAKGAGIVEQAMPTLRHMIGWIEGRMLDYCHRAGWRVERIENGSDPNLASPVHPARQ